MIEEFLRPAMVLREQSGLKRELKSGDGPQGREIVIAGKKVLNFCSNDYLGLAGDERLRAAAIEAIQKEGFGSGASRLVGGNLFSHRRLEERLARFKGTERALMFGTGYMANVGIISSLFGRDDLIFSDKLNHASIIDGILLSGAGYKRYPHNDMAVLERMLRENQAVKKKVIITDSVFSMDGDLAPLDRIAALAEHYGAMVMVDEAHAFGVLGEKGKGAVEHFGLEQKIDIQMGTLSKAAGAFGAYCCGSATLIEYLINHARSFIYTTAVPPSTAAAATRAIDIIEAEPQRREQLQRHAQYLRDEIRKLGFDTLHSETAIIPVVVKDAQLALTFSRTLLERGIFVQAIRPPTVPQNTARLRITVMATHTQKDLDTLLFHLRDAGKDLGLY